MSDPATYLQEAKLSADAQVCQQLQDALDKLDPVVGVPEEEKHGFRSSWATMATPVGPLLLQAVLVLRKFFVLFLAHHGLPAKAHHRGDGLRCSNRAASLPSDKHPRAESRRALATAAT